MPFLDEHGLSTLWTKIKNTFAAKNHNHNNITSDGKVGTVANKPLITSTGGVVTSGSFGTTAGTFCEGNDTRVVSAINSATMSSYVAGATVTSAGTATTATKLTTSTYGGTAQPIYISSGVPTTIGYTISKSVPADANFSNTTYTGASGVTLTGTTFSHTTGAGWNHIPASGSTGQLLGYSAAGVAKWVDPPTGGITSAQAVSAVSSAGYTTSSYVSTYVSGATVASAETATNATNVAGTAGTSTLSWNTDVTLYTVGGNAIKAKLPANPNTNTTYTFATGDSNGQIKVTPSDGTAQNVSVKGLGTAAYTSTGAFASATHTHSYLPLSGGTVSGSVAATAAGTICFVASNTSSLRKIDMRAQSNGNAGIWDTDNGHWMIHAISGGKTAVCYSGKTTDLVIEDIGSSLVTSGGTHGTSSDYGGTVRFPGGMQVCWGAGNIASGGTIVTFASAFSDNYPSVQITARPNISAAGTVHIPIIINQSGSTQTTSTGFKAILQDGGGTLRGGNIFWTAIGRWK